MYKRQVCALVTVPYQMSLRSGSMYGDTMVMNADRMREDCGGKAFPVFYMFDTPDAKAEAEAEEFLAGLTADDNSQVMYESKATVREEFQGFRPVSYTHLDVYKRQGQHVAQETPTCQESGPHRRIQL